MKRKFIKVGFEFTASFKKDAKLSTNLDRCRWNSTEIHLKTNKTHAFSGYKWVLDKFESDSCGCEVSTPIIKNKKDITRYFNEFNQFVKDNNLTINIDNSLCGLGGCHIHLGIGFMSLPFRKRFLRNVGVYLTNNPQLNWGFNDPNDNVNANSLLTQSVIEEQESSFLFNSNIETSCYTNGTMFHTGALLEPFKDNKSPLTAFLSDPTKIFLKKKYALRYNEDYKTLELRIFDMPKNLKQHLLHYEVAMAIFNVCYKATLAKRELMLFYHNWVAYICEPLEVALLKFDLRMKELGIDKNRVIAMKENIITRYKWTGVTNKKGEYKAKDIYLY